jgi:hypothetical protein
MKLAKTYMSSPGVNIRLRELHSAPLCVARQYIYSYFLHVSHALGCLVDGRECAVSVSLRSR